MTDFLSEADKTELRTMGYTPYRNAFGWIAIDDNKYEIIGKYDKEQWVVLDVSKNKLVLSIIDPKDTFTVKSASLAPNNDNYKVPVMFINYEGWNSDANVMKVVISKTDFVDLEEFKSSCVNGFEVVLKKKK